LTWRIQMISTTSVYQTTCTVCVAIRDFFVRVYDAFVEARRLQSAMELAQHLKRHNRLQNMSLGDIVNSIMEDK
jgi:hypothetical protein